MYYAEQYFNAWLIKNTLDDKWVFGPLESESDACFMAEMFNTGKIKLNGDDTYGEKGFEEPYTVHQHVAE